MGIHRINQFFVEEFESPGDLRFRIETDIRIPQKSQEEQDFLKLLRKAVEKSELENVRYFLLERLKKPVEKEGEVVSKRNLDRVRGLVRGAYSTPPPRKRRPPPGRAKHK